jgi:hypothetical protein
MTEKKSDSDIRYLFQQLRQEDQLAAPSFREVLKRQDQQIGWSFFGRLLRNQYALAGLLIFALGLPLFLYFSGNAGSPQLQVESDILEWEAPTDFLLSYGDQSLMTTIPAFDLEIPDWVDEEPQETIEQ